MDSKVQIKLAIIAIVVGAYIGLFSLASNISGLSKLTEDIVGLILLAGSLPLVFFLLYLLFLPLRYKQDKKNIFNVDLVDYKVSEKTVDRLFDKGTDWLIPMFTTIFSYYISLKLLSLIFTNSTWLIQVISLLAGSYLSIFIIEKIVRAEKDNDEHNFFENIGFISKLIYRFILNKGKVVSKTLQIHLKKQLRK